MIQQNSDDESDELLLTLFLLQKSKEKKGSLHEGMWAVGGVVEISLHSLFTLPLDRGERSTSHPGHFTTGEITLVPIEKEAGWSAEQIWTFWREGNVHYISSPVLSDTTVCFHARYMFQFFWTIIRLCVNI
jgi:hypothetical protein